VTFIGEFWCCFTPAKICYWGNSPWPNLPGAITEAWSAPWARVDTQQGESMERLSRAPSRLRGRYGTLWDV